jgi:hypothetical protein
MVFFLPASGFSLLLILITVVVKVTGVNLGYGHADSKGDITWAKKGDIECHHRFTISCDRCDVISIRYQHTDRPLYENVCQPFTLNHAVRLF